jgi:hypothetical protein
MLVLPLALTGGLVIKVVALLLVIPRFFPLVLRCGGRRTDGIPISSIGIGA